MTVQVEFVEKENSPLNQNTRYWFMLNGHDIGTDIRFKDSQYAIVEYDDNSVDIVDDAGYPLVPGNWDYIAVEKHCCVTDKMRAMK